MHEHHYRKVVSILEERHKRRYVWLAHVALFVIVTVFFGLPYRTFSHPANNHVVAIWLVLIAIHLIYVIVQDVRGRMLKRQIEARYGWDRLDDDIVIKRKPLYLEDDGELVEFAEPADEKLKRSY
jgi:uncharacterized membrane protein